MPRETPYIAPEVARRWEEDREWVVGLAGQGRFDDIPDYAFRLLNFDEKSVNIMHYISEGCTGTLLDSPPRSMLLTFSGLFRNRLDEILEIDKAQTLNSGFYWLDIIGCEFVSVSAVFAMIEWWCDGLKTLPLIRREGQFAGLSQLYQAAKMLQVPNAMLAVIGKRLDHVIENKIPTAEDLAAVYEDFPKGHDARRYTLDAWMDGYASGANEEDNIDQLFEGEPELLQDVKSAIWEFGGQGQSSDGASDGMDEMTDEDDSEELNTGADAGMED